MRVFILFTLALFLSGCICQDLIGNNGDDTISQDFCSPPYIQVGDECCLDTNSNMICDSDESTTTTIQQPQATTTILQSTTSLSPATTTLLATTTTFATTTTLVNAACYKDSDCGSKQYQCYGSYFCKDGSVYRDCRIDACSNPGTTDAFCLKQRKDALIQECGTGYMCEDGKATCQKLLSSCSYQVKTAPMGAEVINVTDEYGDEILDYQFQLKVVKKDSEGCVERIYLTAERPSGLTADAEMTWEQNGMFVTDGISAGLLKQVDEETFTIWLKFPCQTTAPYETGSSSLVVNDMEYKGWGNYEFMIEQILYDPQLSCVESVKIDVRKIHNPYLVINPSWSVDANLDSHKVGLRKVVDHNEIEIWIK